MRNLYFLAISFFILALNINGNFPDKFSLMMPVPAGSSAGIGLAGDINSDNDDRRLQTGQIKFFCRWWKDEDVRKGLVNKDSPKDAYVEMNEWAYDYGEGGAVYPDDFDIAFPIKNQTGKAQSFKIQVFSSYKIVSSAAAEKMSEDQMIKAFPWMADKLIYSEPVILDQSDSKEIKIENYHLKEYLAPFYESNNWPWFMRVKVVLSDSEGHIIGSPNIRILNIVPGD